MNNAKIELAAINSKKCVRFWICLSLFPSKEKKLAFETVSMSNRKKESTKQKSGVINFCTVCKCCYWNVTIRFLIETALVLYQHKNETHSIAFVRIIAENKTDMANFGCTPHKQMHASHLFLLRKDNESKFPKILTANVRIDLFCVPCVQSSLTECVNEITTERLSAANCTAPWICECVQLRLRAY